MGLLVTLSEGPKREGEELLKKDQEGWGARRLPTAHPLHKQREGRRVWALPVLSSVESPLPVPTVDAHSSHLLNWYVWLHPS